GRISSAPVQRYLPELQRLAKLRQGLAVQGSDPTVAAMLEVANAGVGHQHLGGALTERLEKAVVLAVVEHICREDKVQLALYGMKIRCQFQGQAVELGIRCTGQLGTRVEVAGNAALGTSGTAGQGNHPRAAAEI